MISTQKAHHSLNTLIGRVCLLGLLLFVVACEKLLEAPKGEQINSVTNSFAGSGQGLIYERDPISATGNSNLVYPDMAAISTPLFVTDNPALETHCSFKSSQTTRNCFQVFNDIDAQSTPLLSLQGGWGYPVGSDEYYQVNTFYHTQKLLKRFFKALDKGNDIINNTFSSTSNFVPPASKTNLESTFSYWFSRALRDPNDPNTIQGIEGRNMKVFSKCYLDPFNAYFSPSELSICLGWNDKKAHLFAAQDPGLIYHELGHALVQVMMNQRNTSHRNFNEYDVIPYQSQLGDLFYDEPNAINEGISDWLAYYMSGEKKFSPWALGRFFNSDRALSEEDSLYNGIVSTQPGERLSYPYFVYFDPNNPTENVEDIHYAGQIASHYLTALTEDIKNSCSFSHENAGDTVLMLISETLAEVGDLTARGSDYFNSFQLGTDKDYGHFFTNLNRQASYPWAHQVHPPNFRKFFQVLAKNLNYHLVNKFNCYSRDKIETLLDEYGLLLFKSYAENKQGTRILASTTTQSTPYSACQSLFSCANDPNYTPINASTQVNEVNRRYSTLVSKNNLQLPTSSSSASPIYIFDEREAIENYLATLTFEGKVVQTSQGTAGVEYNNGNIRISPGEIVGIIYNFFNNSNSIMGGVQILTNDWDHMKLHDPNKTFVNRSENLNQGHPTAHWLPCQIDGRPLESEGGISPEEGPAQEGDCIHSSKDNFVLDHSSNNDPAYRPDAPQPACLVQISTDNETQWVSQDYYRRHVLGLEDKDCLNPPRMSGEEFNPNECLVRYLPGADHAVYGKIHPQETWVDTLTSGQASSTTGLILQQNNVTLMEVNKWIRPGTSFNCRLRARFTNCSDCYDDPQTEMEYPDYEMTGHKPFKVINFEFQVIN